MSVWKPFLSDWDYSVSSSLDHCQPLVFSESSKLLTGFRPWLLAFSEITRRFGTSSLVTITLVSPRFDLHPWFPPQTGGGTPCMCLLCCFACCWMQDWTVACRQLAPLLSPVISGRLAVPRLAAADTGSLFWNKIPAAFCQHKQTPP